MFRANRRSDRLDARAIYGSILVSSILQAHCHISTLGHPDPRDERASYGLILPGDACSGWGNAPALRLLHIASGPTGCPISVRPNDHSGAAGRRSRSKPGSVSDLLFERRSSYAVGWSLVISDRTGRRAHPDHAPFRGRSFAEVRGCWLWNSPPSTRVLIAVLRSRKGCVCHRARAASIARRQARFGRCFFAPLPSARFNDSLRLTGVHDRPARRIPLRPIMAA